MSRRLGLAMALVALCWALVPAGVMAANNGVLFDVRINGNVVRGAAPAGNSLRIVWKRPSGRLVADETIAPFAGGDFGISANGRMKPGDRVSATLDGVKRTFVVPDLTISVDRVADSIEGHAPAGSSVHVDLPVPVDATAAGNGTWFYQDDHHDFTGRVFGSAHWYSAAGDRVDFWAFTPQIFLTLGDSTVHVFGHPGTSATITLTRNTSSGTRIATLQETFGWTGEIWDQFVDTSGQTMRVKPGDHLSAPQIASDMDWIVAGANASGNRATNVVTGQCLDTGFRRSWAYVTVLDHNEDLKGHASVSLDGSGGFSVDFDDPSAQAGDPDAKAADLIRGDLIWLECELTTGDEVIGHFRVS